MDVMAKIITEAEHVCQASPQRAVLVLNGLGSDAALALAFHLETPPDPQGLVNVPIEHQLLGI